MGLWLAETGSRDTSWATVGLLEAHPSASPWWPARQIWPKRQGNKLVTFVCNFVLITSSGSLSSGVEAQFWAPARLGWRRVCPESNDNWH